MEIKSYKKISNNKYKVKLDDKFINLNEETIIKNNMLFKKNIDGNSINKIIEDDKFYSMYNKCVKYISIRVRSLYEIKKYLDKNNCKNSEEIIKKLEDNNLINDEIFVQLYINDKLVLSNSGPYKIKKELLNHKIDIGLIDKHLDKVDSSIFSDKINKIVSKCVKNNTKYSSSILKNKLNIYLINNGYDSNMFLSELNNIKINNNLSIKKEFDKLKNKYNKKYDNINKVNFYVKNSLFKKGYSKDEIENVINK